ncbi:hypothetical protein LUZ60_013566 [Juncus effusus]|nr:hypothetical protein LUZ60_013566 [Juncus effusus]
MEISLVRNLFRTLIFHSIQRCRSAETLCRLSIYLKIHHGFSPPLFGISISDTGVGSSLEEFQRLDISTLVNSFPKWDGKLSITTTGINDKEIQHFCLNLREAPFSKDSLVKLPSTLKNGGLFSGTEANFAIEEETNCEDFVLWAVDFVRKMLILKNPNILFGLSLEQIKGQELKRERLIHENDESHAPFTLSSIECLSFGLKEFSLKHGFDLNKECENCSLKREVLIEGKGVTSNSERNRIKDRIRVEVVILIAPITSHHSCWSLNSPTTQVLCFEDYMPVIKLESCLDVVTSIDWQFYGLKLKNSLIQKEGKIILEWDFTSLARMDIVIHCYHKSYPYFF